MIFLWLVALSSLAVGGEAACSSAPCAQTDYRSYSRCIQNQCPSAVVATGCDQGSCASVYQPSVIPPPPPPPMVVQQPPITVYQPPPPPPPPVIYRPAPQPVIYQTPPQIYQPPPQVYQPPPQVYQSPPQIYQRPAQSCVVNMPYQQCPQQCPSCMYQPYQMGGYQSGCVPTATWPFVRCPPAAMPFYGGFQGMSGFPRMQVVQQQPQQAPVVAAVPRG